MVRRATWRAATLFLIALSTAAGAAAAAQLPVQPLRLAIGFGVDTTGSAQREVFELWRRYLTEPSDSVRAELWSASERARWPSYDLIASYVYQGFSDFTVVRLSPAAGLNDTYVVSTLVSAVDDSTREVRPLALYRVYAVRERGRWVLANALPRMTRTWRQEIIGRITFVHPPDHVFRPHKARACAAFVDSLAAAFGLPGPEPITYYYTSDLGETLRALGLEFFPLGADTVGGRSNVHVRQVYVGSSTRGEDYRHELAHIVLASEVGRETAPLLAEGLMTWTGGSAGLDYSELLPALARYLAEHPALTLESLMEDPPPRVGTLDVGYGGLAALCKLTFDRQGLSGLRAALSAGRRPATLLDSISRRLGISRAALDSLWRASIQAR